MENPLTEKLIDNIYRGLINSYKNSSTPVLSGYPHFKDFNISAIDVCVKRPYTQLFGKVMYPTVLHKTAVIMHSLIKFHPFVDGNKRMALLSASCYLFWNGYIFDIPDDADIFVKKCAENEVEYDIILDWLIKNTVKIRFSIFRTLLGRIFVTDDEKLLYMEMGFQRFFVHKIKNIRGKSNEHNTA